MSELTTINNLKNKKRKRTWNENKIIKNKEIKDKDKNIKKINLRRGEDFVDGYETDDTEWERKEEEDTDNEEEEEWDSTAKAMDWNWNNGQGSEEDIYSGYGFETREIMEGSDDLRLILNAIRRLKKKGKVKAQRGGYRGKKTKKLVSTRCLQQDAEEDWNRDLRRDKYYERKALRQEREKECLKGLVLLDDSDSDESDSEDSSSSEEEDDRKRLVNLVEENENTDQDSSDESDREGTDYVNNMAYREDSLSVMKGLVGGHQVWITSDSGAMIQLMQKDYAKKMGFKIVKLPKRQQFNISAPGGGNDRVRHQVILTVTMKMAEALVSDDELDKAKLNFDKNIDVEMSFGLVEDLPVPILWGGCQMRDYVVHDLHEKKLLSLVVKGKKYVTESKSWLATCGEMNALSGGKVKKAVKAFMPTPARMSNMVTGGRVTTNVGAALYPGRDNIVRLARQNARVDEGLNQVDLVNVEDVFEDYGSMITVLSCVNNGEAYVVVRNNVERTLSLPAGRLVISVKPIMSLPICRTATPEFQELKKRFEYQKEHSEEEESGQPLEGQAPRTSIVWSCRGLTARIQSGDLDGVYKYVRNFLPDMVTFQEVKWQRDGEDHTKISKEDADYEYYLLFKQAVEDQYHIHLNLGPKKYGGQVILLRKQCEQPKIFYNFGETEGQYSHGRVTQLEYEEFINYTIMAPFNGIGQPEMIERRQKWDKAIANEMVRDMKEKPRFLLGNFNAVLEDTDMSEDPGFWQAQGLKTRAIQQVEELLDIGDEGYGGTTANERVRFEDWITRGDFKDASRLAGRVDRKRDFTFRPPGKIKDKGLILDYAFVPSVIVESGGVESSVVFKTLNDKDPYMGSNHRPKWFSLKKNWKEKMDNYNKEMEEIEAKVDEQAREDSVGEALLTSYVLATMFRNNGSDLCPKTKPEEGTEEQLEKNLRMLKRKLDRNEVEGESIRPDEFPEHLWELVDPGQRGFIRQRFEKFKDDEYRQECIDKILKELDINDTGVRHAMKWGKGVNKEGREDEIMRAQALANIDIFFFVDKDTADLAKDVIAEINTTDEKPMRCRPRKLSVVQQAFLQAKTGLMERVGKLEESNSQWCHGLVLVAYEERIKKFMDTHGESAMEKMFLREHEVEVSTFFRLCIDLRMLNTKTIPDIFPLPRIDDLIESIPRKCGRYSISDICDAFFTCNLKKEDRHKTAFKTHDRHLQFAVLPQGFINSPSIFCRMIARTFKGMERGKFSAYIDDVLNHTDDFDEHLEIQQEMYGRLRLNQLTLKVAKTHLNQGRVKFLGHILTKEGRLPDPKSVEAILEWKDPTTTKEVRSFLGATLYYREYIYQYADMAMPLYELIRKGVIVEKVWDPDKHGKAVQQIKEALTSRPVLMQVDNTKKFRLKVDACRVGRGIGCILEQENDEGKWQPVSYYSSSLNKTERQYSATELECKALHDCIIHYAIYLKHVPHFEVFSDHCALKYMQNSDKASTNGRLMRYLMNLQGYNFSIFYRKGTENADADAVSRLLRSSDDPIFLTEDELRDESGVVSKQMLFKARKLAEQNKKMEKEVEKMLRKLAKIEMREMAELNDRILEEGVENLESESGRQRFYDNLKKQGIESKREVVDKNIEELLSTKGEEKQSEEEYMINFVNSVYEVGTVDDEVVESEEENSDEENEHSGSPMDEGVEEEELEYKFQCNSEHVLPHLFANMVKRVKDENRERSKINGQRYNVENFVENRESIRERVKEKQKKTSGGEKPREKIVMNTVKRHNLRKKPVVDYIAEEKIQPNIYHRENKPRRSKINFELEKKRRLGYGQCEIRNSLLGPAAGKGLFAIKKIKMRSEVCSYEGQELTFEQAHGEGYAHRDYVAEAVRDVLKGTVVFIDSDQDDSCYGRYANDPIDESLVNAKILWRNNRLVLIATGDIEIGEEILVSYQKEYWQERLGRLDPKLKTRVMKTYPNEKQVDFRNDSSQITFKAMESPKLSMRKGKEKVKSEVLRNAAPNRMTRRMEEVVEDEEDIMQGGSDCENDNLREEDFVHENVNQCEELADKLRPILNGRKFHDNETGKLYEIYQVRYDEQSEYIIGFRKPLSGSVNREDGSAFLVYGKEGLYELSERYLIIHPEERISVKWPGSDVEWAEIQMDDIELLEIVNQIRTEGGGKSIVEKRGKFKLITTGITDKELLVRVVTQDKGNLEQIVVPDSLRRLTLKIHHEGFSHLGGSRMYATLRRRYYWPGMELDVTGHVKDCINCKLRKSYQRKAKVPVMSYDQSKRVLDRVHIDLTGPLPVTKDGNRYIMVIKDYLTKYVWLIPLSHKTGEQVALKFVNEFICQAGIPDMVVSDRGNEFVNRILKKVASIMDIVRVSTTPYNPRSDGFVENHNKTLKDQLFHFVDNLKQDDWDQYLPVVQLMYNSTVSLTTGYSPMLLMTGREARMPSFEHVNSETPVMKNEMADNQYVLGLVESMRNYQEYAIKQMGETKESDGVRIRKPLEFIEYKKDQLFLRVRRPISVFNSVDDEETWKISMKLLERFEGPYRIIRQINPVLYDAEIEGKEVRVHAVNMKPY